VGKGTSTLSDQEIPGQCANKNDGFSLAVKATDKNGDPSIASKHTDDVENSTVDEPDGILDNVEVNTVAERYDTHGHTSHKSVVIVDAENHAIDELDVVHDSSKAIDTNVDFDNDDVHDGEDINIVDNANDMHGDPNKEIRTVAKKNNVHDVCVQGITQKDENKERETSSADNEVEQNNASPLNIQDIQNEHSNNNVGMEDTDKIQGDDEQNNTSCLEGGSVIPEEQNIVQDGVLFIEDKLTLLDFDNAEDQINFFIESSSNRSYLCSNFFSSSVKCS
jgi:hypothetical protein